jgi:isopentenyl-diphosphate Delta-isomerase
MSAPEQVVLLSPDGEAIGTADKAGVHTTETPLHLAFSCYVFRLVDDVPQLLLTQRALHKPTWGGAWTNTACGHPAPGEPLAEAVRRRVGQELGLALDGLRLVLPRFGYRAVMPGTGVVEHELCPVFAATTASEVAPDPDEVAGTRWVDWAAFRAGVLAGEVDVSPWCVEQVAALPAEPWSAAPADPGELPPAAR